MPESPFPPTPDVPVEVFHGVEVADPYRWLEDADAEATRAWVEAQNERTFAFLGAIPGRDRIRARLTQLWNYERYDLPFREGGRYFYFRNDGLQNQAVLYVADSLDVEPRVLIDPNTLSEDGTVRLAGLSISEDGRRMAYGLSDAGSDWLDWRVRDVDTAKDLPDHLRWIKFSSASWTHDSAGFFYSRYDEPPPGQELSQANYHQKLYYHRVGTEQADDVLIYARPDEPEWGFGAHVTEDGRYAVIQVWQGTDPNNRVFYKDLLDPAAPVFEPERSPVVELLPEADASYAFVGNDGPLFWFLTDRDAPRQRLIGIDIEQPDQVRELIPETGDTLEWLTLVGERFFAGYLHDAHTRVAVFDLQGQPLGQASLPGIGSVWGFGGKRSDRETFFLFTSFTAPAAIYRYDVAGGESTVWRRPQVAFDPERFETKQVFYASKDGTRVPMFITYRKGLQLDGGNPTYLYAYGGFRASITPAFSPSDLVWMELGGVHAIANLRGGGEYGAAWHDAGRRHNKQNVFDDFIAAAEWLISNGYTSPEKLAIAGGSNGGLLVGACLNQRPDLFGAALPAVGVMDMLRYHKFTIGWAWITEYGDPDDPEDFPVLYAYSPLPNVKAGTRYPATLVTTSDHDDRVVPAHSYKFAAALQAAHAGDAPVLIRIDVKAGHGAGKPTSKRIEEAADRLAFLAHALGLPVKAAR